MTASGVTFKEIIRTAGFGNPDSVIQAFLGGSHQHGAMIPGKSDIDIYGVYIEPPVKVIGIDQEEHFTKGTQDQYEKNRPEDEDYKIYTLRRWAGLACQGNPTILGFMFTPMSPEFAGSVWETHILPNRTIFQSSKHAAAFLGYSKGQIKRLKGQGTGRHGQRPELALEFGYDTKAAMHMMRMMYECYEYLSTGVITYPRPEKNVLLEIRQGKWSWDKLFAEYDQAEKDIHTAEEMSYLPEKVDRNKVSLLITDAYFAHWKQKGLR